MNNPTLDDWRAQEGDRTRYSFAAPRAERCTAIHRAAMHDIFGDPCDYIARCGKKIGHIGRHECSDRGAVTLKWETPQEES